MVKDPTSGRMYTRHFEVEGPIAYFETTTNTQVNLENATRSFEVSLDESEAQTQRIQDQQRRGRSPEGIIRDFQEAQSNLQFPLNEREHCRRCQFFHDLCPSTYGGKG